MGFAKFKEDIEKIDDDYKHLGEYFGNKIGRSTYNKNHPDHKQERKLKELFDKTGIWVAMLKEFLIDDTDGLKNQLFNMKEKLNVLQTDISTLQIDCHNLKEQTKYKTELIDTLINVLEENKIKNKNLLAQIESLKEEVKVQTNKISSCEEKYKEFQILYGFGDTKQIYLQIAAFKKELEQCKNKLAESNKRKPNNPNKDIKIIEGNNIKLTNKCISIKSKLASIEILVAKLEYSNILEQQKQLRIKIHECLSTLSKF